MKILKERDDLNFWLSILSGLLAAASLIVGICYRAKVFQLNAWERYGIVAAWALLTPAYFWFDWVLYQDDIKSPENAKHTHDLARNIWIALIIVLSILFQIKWPG